MFVVREREIKAILKIEEQGRVSRSDDDTGGRLGDDDGLTVTPGE